ncbi:hypothetical protein KKG66_06595, partial [bacterium]|nr:hypothetical protein [bacterium]
GAVTSEQETTIETPAGARIYVPEGAVPRLENGNPGTIVFSIEADNESTITPPNNDEMGSSVYLFGPDGFVFEHAVTVEIPLTEGLEPGDKEVNLYRINQTTGEAEYFAGTYHTDRRTVSTQTFHFCPFFLGLNEGGDPRATGCTWVKNNSDKWITLCAVVDSLKYPEVDAGWMPAEGLTSAWAPWNHNIGVTDEGEWWMAQGWYKVCVTYYHDPGEHDPIYTHRWLPGQLIVDNAARHSWSGIANWDCTQLEVGGNGINDTGIQDGRCDCTPQPTVPVGTGDIQVTLTWWNQNSLDLDLWVTDPTGERCYYGNGQAPSTTTTGGQLDRDNLCSNYENGRPENIYWTTTPPAGEYIVEVDWFSSCGHDHGSQAINLRTVVGGTTRTYSSTVGVDETVEVCRFTISGGAATFADGQGKVDRRNVDRPAKN